MKNTNLRRVALVVAPVALLCFTSGTANAMASTGQARVAITAPAALRLDATKDVTKVRTDATNLRAQVKALLAGYLNQYKDRFNATELAQLTTLQTSADRQMVGVISAVNTLRTAIVQKKSPTVIAKAKTAATTAWSNAKKNAEASWTTARGIMEPKLSLFEKIGPLNDYNSMMNQFDALGTAIAAVKVK